MLQKCALFIRGCIRMRTMIIVLILIVTVYVYQNKFQEISNWSVIKNSRENGALFYLNGIWGKMKNIQKISDGRSERAMELFEETKIVNEKSNWFSLEVPKSWTVVSEEGANGNQISKMIIDSSSFSERRETSGIFYDNGAEFSIQIIRGEQANAKLSDGGYGKMLIKKENTDTAGGKISYYVVNDVDVKQGEIIDAHVLHNGNTYNFRLVDNPKIFTNGEFSFQEMLRSFSFGDKK